jgi:hypothetical protein
MTTTTKARPTLAKSGMSKKAPRKKMNLRAETNLHRRCLLSLKKLRVTSRFEGHQGGCYCWLTV